MNIPYHAIGTVTNENGTSTVIMDTTFCLSCHDITKKDLAEHDNINLIGGIFA